MQFTIKKSTSCISHEAPCYCVCINLPSIISPYAGADISLWWQVLLWYAALICWHQVSFLLHAQVPDWSEWVSPWYPCALWILKFHNASLPASPSYYYRWYIWQFPSLSLQYNFSKKFPCNNLFLYCMPGNFIICKGIFFIEMNSGYH